MTSVPRGLTLVPLTLVLLAQGCAGNGAERPDPGSERDVAVSEAEPAADLPSDDPAGDPGRAEDPGNADATDVEEPGPDLPADLHADEPADDPGRAEDPGAVDTPGTGDAEADVPADLPSDAPAVDPGPSEDPGSADAPPTGDAGTDASADLPDVTGPCGAACEGMVEVPAGPFWQGCNEAVDDGCLPAEKPYHEVTVPAFWIDRHEVTVAQFAGCLSGGGCAWPPLTYAPECNWEQVGREEHPVNCITWDHAQAYCAWAGKRLCSESEWERAARGTDGRKYPWGNEPPTCEYAVKWGDGNGCGTGSTWVVGSKPAGASPYGVQDMAGNVMEWIEDDMHPDYVGAPSDGSPWVGEPRAGERVVKGGAFLLDDWYLRTSCRPPSQQTYYYYHYLGARCCRSP